MGVSYERGTYVPPHLRMRPCPVLPFLSSFLCRQQSAEVEFLLKGLLEPWFARSFQLPFFLEM